MFISTLGTVHVTIFCCKWIRKKNAKSPAVGHVKIHVYLCFLFFYSLNPCALFFFFFFSLNLRITLILPDYCWWLERLWHAFVHPCCLDQYKIPRDLFPTKSGDWIQNDDFCIMKQNLESVFITSQNELSALQITHNYETNKYLYFSFWSITKGPGVLSLSSVAVLPLH